eukprot:SAG11_NODE_5215_length_1626_cov_6.117801_1_plen_53_part_10
MPSTELSVSPLMSQRRRDYTRAYTPKRSERRNCKLLLTSQGIAHTTMVSDSNF